MTAAAIVTAPPRRLLCIVPSGTDLPSSRVRVYQYLPHLRAAGWAVRIIPIFPATAVAARPGSSLWLASRATGAARIVLAAAALGSADVVLVHRVFLPSWVLERSRRLDLPVVFDFDDAIYTTPSAPGLEHASLKSRALRMLKAASTVIVASPHLASFAAPHSRNLAFIPSPVDTTRYRPARAAASHTVIGWIGTPGTAPYLNPVLPLVGRLLDDYPQLCFEAVGAGPLDIKHPRARSLPWRYQDEPAALARFSVGIMPIPDDEWSRGKGGYKLLQYMAVGIPSVASPVGINQDIVRPEETGFLAADCAGWEQSLRRLIEDEDLRRRMGARARAVAVERYSVATTASQLLSELERAATDQPRRRPGPGA